MRHPIRLSLLAASVILASSVALLRADEISDKGREIYNLHQHAVVTVEAVQKVNASTRSSGPREVKQDLTGTVVDPSGLVVMSLSALDPAEIYRKLSEDSKTEIEISDIKILQEDGTESPAEIALRDKDLDVVFIRPKTKPAAPVAAIDLSKSSSAQLLDQLIALNRLRRVAGRAFSASVERVSSVVQKPRTFYIPDNGASETTLGCPAFALDGTIVGLFVMRAVSTQGTGNLRDSVMPIILPAADILKSVQQALEAKPAEDKKEASKDASGDAKAPAK